MASAMDAYNLLQQAMNAGSEEEKKSLVNKSMNTLKQAASGEPANSGTTADTQGQNQTATTQQQQQSDFNIDNAITGSELTREEAIEWMKGRTAYSRGVFASLESARKRGDAKLIAVYEKQLEADIRMTQERYLNITNNVTGETSVAGAVPVSDGRRYTYDKQAAVERAKSSQGVETYLRYETDRILAGSTTTKDITVVGYEVSKGKYRARMSDGSLGPRRNTREEAAESAKRSFIAGQKVAETAEQRAALLALATKARQFGGTSVDTRMVTDIVEKAMPEAGRNAAFNLAASIRPAVIFKQGQAITAYGKELNISWEERNGYWRPTIYSPEGVRLTDLRLNDPTQSLIEFGLDKNKLIEAYQYGKSQGYLSQGSNSENLLAIAQQEGNQQALNMLSQMGDGSLPFMEALIANDGSQGYLEKMRIQSALPGGGVMSSSTRGLRTNQYQQNILGDEAGILAGFGVSPFASQEDNEKRKLEYLQNYAVYQTVFDNDTDYRPSWTQESYLQTLNQAFGTPNNNITFGQGGLQYSFGDGTAISWGPQLKRLDALSATIGIQKLSVTQGAAFKAANNFNSKLEYDEWRKTQNLRAGYFESMPQASVDTQMEQVMAPTVATPTDTGVDTGTTTDDTTTGGGTTYVGAPTDEGGTPVATDPTDTGTGTGTGTIMGGGTTYGMQPITGTFGTPLQTSGLSAVPTFNYNQPVQQQAGFTPQQLTSTMPGMGGESVGVQTVQYTNQFGQSIPVTENNGQPITYVPPGYTKTTGAAQGGLMRRGYADGGLTVQQNEDGTSSITFTDKAFNYTPTPPTVDFSTQEEANAFLNTYNQETDIARKRELVVKNQRAKYAQKEKQHKEAFEANRVAAEEAKNKVITGRDILNPASNASKSKTGKPTYAEWSKVVSGLGTPENAALALNSDMGDIDARNWKAILASENPYKAAMDAKQAQLDSFDPRHFRELARQYVGTNKFGDAAAGSQYLLQLDEKTSNYLKDINSVSPKELMNAEVLVAKNPNTGQMDTAVYYKNPETTTPYIDRVTYRLQSFPWENPTGGPIDPKSFENLPNYPDEFKQVMGRPVTQQDFADYGYTNPQGTYDSITGGQTQDTTTIGDQTQEVFEPYVPVNTPPVVSYTTGMPNYGQQSITNTSGTPLQSASLSAVPQYQQQPMSGTSAGVQTMQNNIGSNYAAGGVAENTMLEAKYRIASMNGYRGPKTNAALNAFANASEGMKRKFNAIGTVMANKGGYIKGFVEGGVTSLEDFNAMQQGLITQTMQPQQSGVDLIQPTTEDFIPTTAGQVGGTAPYAEAATVGTVQQAGMPTVTDASTMTPTMVTPGVQGVTSGMQPVTGTVSDQAQVTAAQQETSAVSDLKAQQGTAIMMDNPVQREIQDGELISGAANAQKAAEFAEQIEAATAEPSAKATVQGQLEGLMQQFEGGNTPAWAAGSMRAAMANLSARGLGASSLAGQAVIQAAMEAALPIAQMDAQTQAQFESQNLSNRQQRAMLAAQQRAAFIGQEFDQAFQARVANSARIGDIANMNFTAEQNIALENSRAANTMNLQNLSNAQAMVMAEAAALANLDMANLNNRQQAAVQNAQNFLQMDMTNLGFEQQTAMFKAQQNIQALFTDQAAENAAAQFNASSENQTNQFFASLTSQTSQFNAAQQNAMDQFNVNSVNAIRQFNSEIQQQRDMFNAQNGLVVAQANAQWRQNIATLNQAAQNESNMDFAKTINALTSTNLDQIWQRERDIMSFAFSAQQSALDRSLNLLLGDKKIAEVESQLSAQKDAASTELAFRFLFGSDPSGIFGGIFNK